MSEMIVHGIILTKDTKSMKILYEKNNKYFIRSGKDNFKVGIQLPASYMALFTQYGFRKVNKPLPAFLDSAEMLEGATKFQLTKEGSVSYYAG